MTGYAIVSTTVASDAEARELARSLVEARLAACVQITPVRSIYRWRDAIEEADEMLLACKIAASDFALVCEAIRSRHTYALPEIVMVPIAAADEAYRDWMAAEVRRDVLP